MIDVDCWSAIEGLLSIVDHNRRPTGRAGDSIGRMHLVLFGDFKQLPPATSKAPFIVLPRVHNTFNFRVLRENRRATGEGTDEFHRVLADVAWCEPTEQVADFIVDAYVRGAVVGCAQRAEVEGSTSVFTKRRYRDQWNRIIVRRIAKTHSHSLKIKGKCRARGARNQQWYNEHSIKLIRRRVRTQALWNLHLAGDWHPSYDGGSEASSSHLMRVMLVANLAVDQRFANGTQGRLLQWHPSSVADKKALPASYPDLLARFAKESSLSKREMYPEIDHIDITARPESLALRGEPVLLQLPLMPAYALTSHKVQSLSIKHTVRGCLEGVFAMGQVYVMASRVVKPRDFQLIGIPPKDLIDRVARALQAAGHDVDTCFKRAASVTDEWSYSLGDEPVSSRIQPKWSPARKIPIRLRTLAEILDPQPRASVVIRGLLSWIDRADIASQRGGPRPAFSTPTGEHIFPDEPWWLTELERRTQDEPQVAEDDEDGPASSAEDCIADDAALTDDEDPPSDGDGLDAEASAPHDPELAWSIAEVCTPSLPVGAAPHGGVGVASNEDRGTVSPFMRVCGNLGPAGMPVATSYGISRKRKHHDSGP